jgi:DNA-3-methyladenine glycosylase II
MNGRSSVPTDQSRVNGSAIGRMSSEEIARGIRRLRKADPILGAAIGAVGPWRLKFHRNHFHALARAIVFQQISGHAARTIWTRVVALSAPDRFTAKAVLELPDERLRSAGLSPQKLRYLRDLSSRVEDGRLRLSRLARLQDDQIIEQLTAVSGIGVWTAQMFLLFSLGRPDVFAPDDLGLRSAIRKLYGLNELPNRAQSHEISARWQPYRSIASWYLWRSLELK